MAHGLAPNWRAPSSCSSPEPTDLASWLLPQHACSSPGPAAVGRAMQGGYSRAHTPAAFSWHHSWQIISSIGARNLSSTKWSVLSQKHSWEESQPPENGVLWVPRMLLLHGFLPYGVDYLFCCCFNWEKKEAPTRLSSHHLHSFQEACGGGEGTSRAWGSKGTWIKHGCEPVRKGGPAALLHGVPSCRRVLPRPRGNSR